MQWMQPLRRPWVHGSSDADFWWATHAHGAEDRRVRAQRVVDQGNQQRIVETAPPSGQRGDRAGPLLRPSQRQRQVGAWRHRGSDGRAGAERARHNGRASPRKNRGNPAPAAGRWTPAPHPTGGLHFTKPGSCPPRCALPACPRQNAAQARVRPSYRPCR